MTEEQESGTITINKTDLWRYSTFILGALLIVSLFFNFSGNSFGTTGNVVNNGDAAQLPAAKAKVSVDDDAMEGNKNAKVTVIAFSDYQCPFCRKFWTDTYGQLKKDYIDTGKIRFVFRDFPLSSIHPAAEVSAEAAECVREKGGDAAYFKMHDKIFMEGNIIDSGSPTGAVTKTAQYGAPELKKWAKDLGYNIDSCLDSGKYKDEVAKDQSDGAASGVTGTPAFFINGKLLSGAQPYANFKAEIDAALG